jgi:hypothetical protein
MSSYAPNEQVAAQQKAALPRSEHSTDRRASTDIPAPVHYGHALLHQSPRSQSLLQMRQALDEGPRVQSQLALQRALNRPRAPEANEDEEPEQEARSEPAQLAAMPGEADKLPSPVQRKPNATGMPDQLKAGVEQLSGLAMDDVRVHFNSPKPATVQAHAYAQGTNIHLAPGQEKHLSHEAWHVVQQKQGRVKPTLQMKGIAINDDAGLEREADVMGARATMRDTPAYGRNRDRAAETIRGGAIQRLIVKKDGTRFANFSAAKTQLTKRKGSALTEEEAKKLEDIYDNDKRTLTVDNALAEASGASNPNSMTDWSIGEIDPESPPPDEDTEAHVRLTELLESCYVRPPENDLEGVKDIVAEAEAIWLLCLGPDDDIDANELGRILLEYFGGDEKNRIVRYMWYYLGLTHSKPQTAFGSGSFDFELDENNQIVGLSGRPALSVPMAGTPATARRHITAWHTLLGLMNNVLSTEGVGGLVALARVLRHKVNPGISASAEKIARRVSEGNEDHYWVVWLAIVLNNVPSNLWLGSAKENISINTMASYFRQWSVMLRDGDLTVAQYAAKILGYRAGSTAARKVINLIIGDIAQARKDFAADFAAFQNQAIGETVLRNRLPLLEIDTKEGGEADPNDLIIYEYSRGLLPLSLGRIYGALVTFLNRDQEEQGQESSGMDDETKSNVDIGIAGLNPNPQLNPSELEESQGDPSDEKERAQSDEIDPFALFEFNEQAELVPLMPEEKSNKRGHETT